MPYLGQYTNGIISIPIISKKNYFWLVNGVFRDFFVRLVR